MYPVMHKPSPHYPFLLHFPPKNLSIIFEPLIMLSSCLQNSVTSQFSLKKTKQKSFHICKSLQCLTLTYIPSLSLYQHPSLIELLSVLTCSHLSLVTSSSLIVPFPPGMLISHLFPYLTHLSELRRHVSSSNKPS